MITAAEPFVFVSDFARARDFYVGKLGFALETTYGDPPSFGILRKDAARLCIRRVDRPVFVDGVREREQLPAASLTLASAAGIAALFDAWRAAGVDLFQHLRTEPWSALTFIVRDPDGNLLLVAAPATQKKGRSRGP